MDIMALPTELETATKSLAMFETRIKELKAKEEEVKKIILEGMEERGLLEIETEELKVTYIAPTDTEYFDKTAFKKENQELYDKYVSMRERKSYIKLKVK